MRVRRIDASGLGLQILTVKGLAVDNPGSQLHCVVDAPDAFIHSFVCRLAAAFEPLMKKKLLSNAFVLEDLLKQKKKNRA